jgi:hypothetical protein
MAGESEPSDHVRPTGSGAVPIYRVVGVSADAVTLLRVTDESETRVYSGTVQTVERAAFRDEYESASDPGTPRDPIGYLRGWIALGRNLLRR